MCCTEISQKRPLQKELRYLCFTIALSIITVFMNNTAYASVSDFAGNWTNIDRNTRGITKISISDVGRYIRIQVWGKCRPQDCDWGTTTGYLYTDKVTTPLKKFARAISAIYIKSYANSIITLEKSANGRIRATVYTRFTDNSRRNNYTSSYLFERKYYRLKINRPAATYKAPVTRNPAKSRKPLVAKRPPIIRQPPKVSRMVAPKIKDTPVFRSKDCIRFNPNKLQVRKIRGRWRIVSGSTTLKNFKKNSKEARRSLKVIRHYQFNKQCTVGRTSPSMEYYLVSNRTPNGSMRGEDCITFNPNSLKVLKLDGRWQLANKTRWILNFQHKQRLARKSLHVIKRYRFSKICFIGRPQPSLTYFRK